jgi:hypothetical protein
MPEALPTYEECLRIFKEEIDEHLNWQEAQSYYGLLSLESGWKMSAHRVFEELWKLKNEGKVPSPRFQRMLDTFYSLYAS